MNITLVCSDSFHPVNVYLKRWIAGLGNQHNIELVRVKAEAKGGDFLFLISCKEVFSTQDLARYRYRLVLHASDLPQGRGWSPHIWELSKGVNFITLSLLEAADKVDSGDIWKKVKIQIPKDALWDEINNLLFTSEVGLIDFAINNFSNVKPNPQLGEDATYYQKRSPMSSEIDPEKSIAEQFDLIRVCDPDRFPAFFYFRGYRYFLRLEKINE